MRGREGKREKEREWKRVGERTAGVHLSSRTKILPSCRAHHARTAPKCPPDIRLRTDAGRALNPFQNLCRVQRKRVCGEKPQCHAKNHRRSISITHRRSVFKKPLSLFCPSGCFFKRARLRVTSLFTCSGRADLQSTPKALLANDCRGRFISR